MKIPLAAVLGLCVLTPPCVVAGNAARAIAATEPGDSPAPDTTPSNPQTPRRVQRKTLRNRLLNPRPNRGQRLRKTCKHHRNRNRSRQLKKKAAAKKRRHRKPAAPSPAVPEKKVIRNGGTADPVVQLAPGMSEEQASSQRQSTSQLLAAADANLKQISSRQLNSTQQDSVSQIKKYMEQAKAAEKAGDVQRAHNLASKAVMLSDDMAKH